MLKSIKKKHLLSKKPASSIEVVSALGTSTKKTESQSKDRNLNKDSLERGR